MSKHYLETELYQLVQNDSSIFEFLQEGSLDGVWYWDLEDGENEWMSSKFWKLLGYDPSTKEHIASAWQDIIFKEDFQKAKENLQKHLEDPNHPYDQIVRYKHKNGHTVWVRCRGIAIRDESGTPLRMLGAHNDITQLKELQLHLEQRVQEETEINKKNQLLIFQKSRLEEMGSILNMIAHQWRQPLNTISIVVNSILAKYKKQNLTLQSANELKNEFQKQIHYMSKTIDDFQNFFKPTKEKSYFSLDTTLLETIELLSPIFKKNKIKISLHIQESIEFFGYETELKQVLLNLIGNAKDALIEHKIPNKQILLTLEKNNGEIFIHCQDNGGGVSEKIINNIFDPYFSTKTNKKGSGLGLYISKVIIEDHFKGRLELRNKGDGAEFCITLYPKY